MTNVELRSICNEVLEEGLDILGLSLGIVSKVDLDAYQIVAVMADDDVFQIGDVFDLQNTFCRDVVKLKSSMALTHLDSTRGLCKHPLYSGLPLESYIAAPILVDEQVWGTLNFSSMKIRAEDFAAAEIELIESRAASIAQYIKQQQANAITKA